MSTTRIRRMALAAAIILALAFAFAAAMTAYSRTRAVEAAATEPECLYILSGFGGYVAVFDFGEALPRFITDTRVDSLPPADRQMLAEGIRVYSENELASLLEDYGS